jgi:hypothetical protein
MTSTPRESQAAPSEVAQPPVLPAYRQAFANPQRNSAVGAVLAPLRSMEPLIDLGSMHYSSIEWLLGTRDATRVALVGSPRHGDIVRLSPPERIGTFTAREHALPVFAEDSDQLVIPIDRTLRRPDMNNIAEPDGFRESRGAQIETLFRALIARDDHYFVLSQRKRTHTQRVTIATAGRAQWDARSDAPGGWRHPMLGVQVDLSPALSDDTLIVSTFDRLIYLAAQGSAVANKLGMFETTVIAEVIAALAPKLVAVDLQDRVWGFRVSDLALVGWSARGESLGAPLTLGVTPVQPPVALPDGALAIIAPGNALKVKDGAIVWRALLPEGPAPLATADAQGTLVVRVGRELLVLDNDGRTTWSATLPEPITSNPLITTTGRLCVATGLVLRCSG